MSGVIAASSAIAGQMAESNAVVFHIVDPTRLWVEALAYGSSGAFSRASAEVEGVKALALSSRVRASPTARRRCPSSSASTATPRACVPGRC